LVLFGKRFAYKKKQILRSLRNLLLAYFLEEFKEDLAVDEYKRCLKSNESYFLIDEYPAHELLFKRALMALSNRDNSIALDLVEKTLKKGGNLAKFSIFFLIEKGLELLDQKSDLGVKFITKATSLNVFNIPQAFNRFIFHMRKVRKETIETVINILIESNINERFLIELALELYDKLNDETLRRLRRFISNKQQLVIDILLSAKDLDINRILEIIYSGALDVENIYIKRALAILLKKMDNPMPLLRILASNRNCYEHIGEIILEIDRKKVDLDFLMKICTGVRSPLLSILLDCKKIEDPVIGYYVKLENVINYLREGKYDKAYEILEKIPDKPVTEEFIKRKIQLDGDVIRDFIESLIKTRKYRILASVLNTLMPYIENAGDFLKILNALRDQKECYFTAFEHVLRHISVAEEKRLLLENFDYLRQIDALRLSYLIYNHVFLLHADEIMKFVKFAVKELYENGLIVPAQILLGRCLAKLKKENEDDIASILINELVKSFVN